MEENLKRNIVNKIFDMQETEYAIIHMTTNNGNYLALNPGICGN